MTLLNRGMLHISLLVFIIASYYDAGAQKDSLAFNVIAFYTAKNDPAHISFVHEAHRWFGKVSAAYHFQYDSTNNWNDLNAAFLSKYQVVIFLDTRPEAAAQRQAFEEYM